MLYQNITIYVQNFDSNIAVSYWLSFIYVLLLIKNW